MVSVSYARGFESMTSTASSVSTSTSRRNGYGTTKKRFRCARERARERTRVDALQPADADDFEINQRLGVVTFRVERETPRELTWRASADGGAPESLVASSRDVDDGSMGESCVNLYAGRYVIMPAEPPTSRDADRGLVMLKEYVGEEAAAFAETEVRAYERLLSDDDVEIVVDEYGRGPGMLPKRALPIARLVGYFSSGSVDGEGRSLWTVQEWHGVRRLGEYPQQKQETGSETKFWPPVQRVQDQPKKARARYVRKAIEQCIKGVWYAHQRGVAHGAIDASTFLCNTFSDKKADELEVRLINFGSSTLCTPESVVVDLRALAGTLTELVFSAFSLRGSSEATSADAMRRLFVDIHELDFKRIRAYCEEESDWVEVCEFLGDNGGEYWELFRELWQAEELMDGYGVTTSAENLADRAEFLRSLLEQY